MRILAADTATEINTVAVCDDDEVLAETIVRCERAHTERLLETVDWVLDQASAKLGAMDALAISVGPGSFTGLRVGVATWKGLAVGAKLPLVGVPTLDAMTRVAPFRDGCVCPLLDARMGEVFGALYCFEGGQRLKLRPDAVGRVETLLEDLPGPVTFLGNGAALFRARIHAAVPEARFAPAWCALPRAAAVAAEARSMIETGTPADAAQVIPVYLRPAQAEKMRKK
ncbi:MAG: tRNA (adenosine(37)-N6)-threonylcarbamoyltransferase complex dimerization subunit type 1 TsaB [Candidatus Hydrogenedentes bacterium]|nr:tRNA (adenosine(37)-N6)-threonylcarbamoyltransferase complex dimerization subunit type 1 TsaB [Candidatus Hydrogenedentota bacterium]